MRQGAAHGLTEGTRGECTREGFGPRGQGGDREQQTEPEEEDPRKVGQGQDGLGPQGAGDEQTQTEEGRGPQHASD